MSVRFVTYATPLNSFVIKFNLFRPFLQFKVSKISIAPANRESRQFLFCHSLAAISRLESDFTTTLHVMQQLVSAQLAWWSFPQDTRSFTVTSSTLRMWLCFSDLLFLIKMQTFDVANPTVNSNELIQSHSLLKHSLHRALSKRCQDCAKRNFQVSFLLGAIWCGVILGWIFARDLIIPWPFLHRSLKRQSDTSWNRYAACYRNRWPFLKRRFITFKTAKTNRYGKHWPP